MKSLTPQFVRLQEAENLHTRVTRTLALQVIKAERQSQLVVFPNEAELCKQLGVSRSILRESVKVLADKGMVQVRPRSGTRARTRSEWNLLDADILCWQAQLNPDLRFLRDLCEVRLAIEPIASGFAALRATEEEMAFIRRCMEERLDTFAAKDLTGAINAELRFHTSIVAASHNPLFHQLNATISDPLRVALNTLRLPASATIELEETRKLTEAIADRNPLAARRSAEEIVGFAMLAVEKVIHEQDATRAAVTPPRRKPKGRPLHDPGSTAKP